MKVGCQYVSCTLKYFRSLQTVLWVAYCVQICWVQFYEISMNWFSICCVCFLIPVAHSVLVSGNRNEWVLMIIIWKSQSGGSLCRAKMEIHSAAHFEVLPNYLWLWVWVHLSNHMSFWKHVTEWQCNVLTYLVNSRKEFLSLWVVQSWQSSPVSRI